MRAVITRVLSASVSIDGNEVSKIGKGFLVLLGVHKNDTEENAKKMADKICGLRIFEDENGKMNISPKDAGAQLLIVSQFTLYADCSSRRPGFSDAARPDLSKPLYELVVSQCRERGFETGTGEFGADMKVESVNDGPVTIVLDVGTTEV
ncbi:MAG: D-tyrosyl-tRNA(Tyr) deacylase [Lachnospiraceae bacterium]|nr:D-tyrosyl-tRNA(Tyr) deacylase [Lachnospiraceae bacterium]MBR5766731.1 D-tyrosyl-tRNA(Tyr) deacylase [Lachnospiraceae bacterium]MBR6469624.1 D-tyrosyl-tRNA(Tyr) deacylase [Lachnospiraceae bacterium]